jgi:hypothetical protein
MVENIDRAVEAVGKIEQISRARSQSFRSISQYFLESSLTLGKASKYVIECPAVHRKRFDDLLNRSDNLFRSSNNYRKGSPCTWQSI